MKKLTGKFLCNIWTSAYRKAGRYARAWDDNSNEGREAWNTLADRLNKSAERLKRSAP